MEISPYMLFLLLVYSFLFGMAAGAFESVNKIIRALLGVSHVGRHFEKLYDMRLPLVKRVNAGSGERKIKKGLALVLIFFQDFLLLIFLACGTVILNYYLNRGQFRLYTIAAVAAGFAVYYFTIGKIVAIISEGIVFFIKAALKIMLYVVSRPFFFVWRGISKIARIIVKNISLVLAKKKIIRYNRDRRKELFSLAERGFMLDDYTRGE
ncbi:MAG: spore cortex biosynthesis protein YabQ [Clostridia bacterium]|nr:spore cortex biosynthesis protein YabQ [Clostridia bacterium]